MGDIARFERVFTVTDFYDGPRGGIADFQGRPHHYESLFKDFEPGCTDDVRDVFELRPVDDETLRLALEDWEMWLAWEAAFYASQATIDTHPVLPADRARHDEIDPLIVARIAALPGPPVQAYAEFQAVAGSPDEVAGRTLEVKWEPLPPG